MISGKTNMNDSFTVTSNQWGVLISFPICPEEIMMLCKFYKKRYGYDIFDALIGQKYSSLCLTCEHDSKQWRKELGIE